MSAAASADVTTTGLKLWLKGASSPNPGEGQPVQVWKDDSGKGLDVAGHAGSSPTYVTNVIRGNPGLHSEQRSYLFRYNVLGSDIAGATGATLFWAANPSTLDGRDSILGWGDSGIRLVLHTPYSDKRGSNYYFQHGGSHGGALVQ